MEESQKNQILKNINKLIVNTTCNATLLAELVSREVLSIGDVETLEAEKTNSSKALQLYRLLINRRNAYEHLFHALQETNQSDAASIISQRRHIPGTSYSQDIVQQLPIQQVISFNVRQPVQLFTGREQELQIVKDMVQSYNHCDTKLIAVTGLGGIGKSELCRRFIQKHSEAFDRNTIWINAERAESITESFRRLAKDVLLIGTRDANGDEKDIASIVEEVYRQIGNLGKRSLLVFDNVDNLDELNTFLPIQPFSSSNSKPPYILVTSRDREWEFDINVLYLRELNTSEGIEFVKRGLKAEESDEAVLELVTKLHGLPLAIQQAISFMNVQRHLDKNFNVQKYLQLFETNSKLLLDSKGPASSFTSYNRTTFTTWKLTTEVIASDLEYGQLALKMLHFISYLAADNIQKRVLLRITESDEMGLMLGLRLLVKYSMVNSDPQLGTININRLVQEVTRLQLKNDGKEEAMLQQLIGLIFTYLDMDNEYEDIIDHAVCAWTHCRRHQSVFMKFALVPIRILERLSAIRRFDEACQFGGECLASSQYPSECVHSLGVKYGIGNAVFKQGKYKQASEIFEQVREKLKTIAGELDVGVIQAENYLGVALIGQGLYRRALEMFQSVFRKRKEVYGQDNIYTADAFQGIATCWERMGHYNETLSIFQECFRRYKALLCEHSDRHLLLKKNSALVYGYVVDMKVAERMLRNVYQQRLKMFGNDDLSTVSTRHSIAISLYEQEIYEESHVICKDVLERYNILLGEEHPNTLAVLNNIGRILRHQEKYDSALAIHEDVYLKLAKNLEKNHPEVLLVKRDIFVAKGCIEKHAQTLVDDLLEILKTLENLFGEKSYIVVETKLEIAVVLKARGDNETAKAYLSEATEMALKVFGESCLVGRRSKELLRNIIMQSDK